MGRELRLLAQDPETAILRPNSAAKDLPTILHDLSPDDAAHIGIEEEETTQGIKYTFHDEAGGKIVLNPDQPGVYRADSSGSEKMGTPIYQAIYTWAHNNDIVLDEDHKMHPDGVYRRTSHMLSSALRFNTTRHMRIGPRSGLEGRWDQFGESQRSVDHNVGLLGLREAEIVRARLPELRDLRYDPETGSFYDGEYRIPNGEAQAYFRKRIGAVDPEFSRRVGDATFRRALAAEAAQRAGADGGLRLVGETSGAPQSLHEIRYTKTIADEGGESTNDRSRSAAAGEESPGVSGDTEGVASGIRERRTPRAAREEREPGLYPEVQHTVEAAAQAWKLGDRLEVADSLNGITNPRVKAAMAADPRIKGAYDPNAGRIYVRLDRLANPAEAERVVRHEGLHYVIDRILPHEFTRIVDSVGRLIPADDRSELTRMYPDHDARGMAEEYLAYLGENNPRSSIWRNFVYEVKRALHSVLGDRIQFSDADILAFLNKSNRRLKGRSGSGISLTTDGDIRFAKGDPERTNWAEVRRGDRWDAVKKYLPKENESMPLLEKLGSEEDIYRDIERNLLSEPIVSDPWGGRVLLVNPEGKGLPGLRKRVEHLAGRREKTIAGTGRQLDDYKAKTSAAISETIKHAQAKVAQGNEMLYFRRYKDGIVHMVVVDPDGGITDHGAVDHKLLSQYAPERARRFEGAKVLETRTPPPALAQSEATVGNSPEARFQNSLQADAPPETESKGIRGQTQ